MQNSALPVGKLPPELLAELLASTPVDDSDIVVGPGIGFDCAVVSVGDRNLVYLAMKSDPITFVTDDLGWYLVHVNANDLATTGAIPRWMLVTLLFPEGTTDPATVLRISGQIHDTCRRLGISVVGGHTEITYGLTRPLAVGTLLGEVSPEKLVTPAGMRPGDRVLLTKGVPIEATSVLAREFASELEDVLTAEELENAANFHFDPGISVVRDAQIAVSAGRVTAMHDPTEGGLAAALWELAEAAKLTLLIDSAAIQIPPVAAKLCGYFKIDPLAALASGALLMTVAAQDAGIILSALARQEIHAAIIGKVHDGPAEVWDVRDGEGTLWHHPQQDAIARLFEKSEG